ncbi:hypothetical protein [Spiroplasma endosymbiont of Notiophilus biguttatus]
MLQLEETKQEIINNTNLMKNNIKNYHQKIIEFRHQSLKFTN